MSLKSWYRGPRILIPLLSSIIVTVASAQTIIRNFPGVSFDDTQVLGTPSAPPDTMGAAGPNHFVEFINGAFAIYSKDGVRQTLITDVAFWENAGISSATLAAGLTDTRIAYDAASDRWFATELTLDYTGNQLLIARSDSGDPGGSWKALHFTANTGTADYDTLGVDSVAVYVGVNDFDTYGNLTGVSFFSIPKADLIAATPTLVNMTRFDNLSATIYGFTPQGVSNAGAGTGHGLFIAIDDAAFQFVDRATVYNPGSAGATLSTRTRIPISYDSFPNPANQPGGETVDTIDDRFTGAVRQVGGNLFMANTILQGNHDAVHWLVINESNNTVVGEGLISDSSHDFFQPTIAANDQGRILLAFNRSGTTAPGGNIAIYGALGNISGATVTMGAPFLIKSGSVSDYGPSFDYPPYRWGDYSATMLDPTDDNLFWTIQEIPVAAGSWGTQVTLISVATNRPSLTITPAGANLSISWPLSTDPAYQLQSTTNLTPPVTWSLVTAPISTSINQNVVSVPLSDGSMFFRLQK